MTKQDREFDKRGQRIWGCHLVEANETGRMILVLQTAYSVFFHWDCLDAVWSLATTSTNMWNALFWIFFVVSSFCSHSSCYMLVFSVLVMAHRIGCCLLVFNWVRLDIRYLFLCNRTHLPSCFYSIQVVVWVGSTTNPKLGQTESFVPLNNWFPQIEGCLGTIVVVILRRRCYGMLLSRRENNKVNVTLQK